MYVEQTSIIERKNNKKISLFFELPVTQREMQVWQSNESNSSREIRIPLGHVADMNRYAEDEVLSS